MNNVLQTICDALANKKCVNTKVLDVRELTTIADYFVLTSARNKKNRVCQEFCVNRFNKQHRIAA